MAGWVDQGNNRWVRDGDSGHLLLRNGTRLVELHGTTVHVYEGSESADLGNPLSGATWLATRARPDLAGSATAAAWKAMGAAEYTTGTLTPEPAVAAEETRQSGPADTHVPASAAVPPPGMPG